MMKPQMVKFLAAIAFGTAAVTGTSCGGTDGADRITYTVMLTGMQVVPAVKTAGLANVTVALDMTTGTITITGLFGDLSSPATAAHVHGPAAVGSSGPVLSPLTVPPDLSGAVTGSASMSTTQMADMLNGMTYVDVHTHYFPDGEIRAQVSDVQ